MLDFLSSQKSEQKQTQQQIGVQTGEGGALTYGGLSGVKGNVAAQGSQQYQFQGSRGNVSIETTDPAAFESVSQANLVVGEVANTGITLANQSLIRSLETLQTVSNRQTEVAESAVESSQELAKAESPSGKQDTVFFWIATSVALVLFAFYFVFTRKH